MDENEDIKLVKKFILEMKAEGAVKVTMGNICVEFANNVVKSAVLDTPAHPTSETAEMSEDDLMYWSAP